MTDELKVLRDKIDALDREIARLLAERFAVVREIGEVKKALSLPVLNEAREAIVLEKVSAEAGDDRTAEAIRRVYRAVMDAAKTLE